MAMSSVQWTKEMDVQLIACRVTAKIAWKAVAVITASGQSIGTRECQNRLKILQANGGAPVAAPAAEAKEPGERDGLIWLAKKKRLKHVQLQEALHYRDLFRRDGHQGASIKSCLDIGAGVGGGSGQGMLPMGGSFSDSAAVLELFVIRWNVLLGQVDLLTVMDGVCGLGHTVRFLAGGEQLRSAQLEAALRIALDMMVANRRAKEAALAAREAGSKVKPAAA